MLRTSLRSMLGLQLQSLCTTYSTAGGPWVLIGLCSREYNQDETSHLLHMKKRREKNKQTGQGIYTTLVKTVEAAPASSSRKVSGTSSVVPFRLHFFSFYFYFFFIDMDSVL